MLLRWLSWLSLNVPPEAATKFISGPGFPHYTVWRRGITNHSSSFSEYSNGKATHFLAIKRTDVGRNVLLLHYPSQTKMLRSVAGIGRKKNSLREPSSSYVIFNFWTTMTSLPVFIAKILKMESLGNIIKESAFEFSLKESTILVSVGWYGWDLRTSSRKLQKDSAFTTGK